MKLFIFLLLGLVYYKSVAACSCVGESTVENAVKSADYVVLGKIMSKELVKLVDSSAIKLFYDEDKDYDHFPYVTYIKKYDMLLEKQFKGRIISDTITIYTRIGSGDCGIRFQIGETYIVYGQKETYFGGANNEYPYPQGKRMLWTNSCTRTQLRNDQEIQAIEGLK